MYQNLNRLVCTLLFCIPASSSQADLLTSLAGYWQFDGSGADLSGMSNDLTVNGTGYASGLMGQAVDFSGKSQSKFATRAGDDNVFDVQGSDFSVQLWVNYNSTSSERTWR